jgi:hypothetical protein
MFRECILAMFGGTDADGKKAESKEQQYCRLCKASKKDTDCASCEMN